MSLLNLNCYTYQKTFFPFTFSNKCYFEKLCCLSEIKLIYNEIANIINENILKINKNCVYFRFCSCVPLYFQALIYYSIYDKILNNYKQIFYDYYLNGHYDLISNSIANQLINEKIIESRKCDKIYFQYYLKIEETKINLKLFLENKLNFEESKNNLIIPENLIFYNKRNLIENIDYKTKIIFNENKDEFIFEFLDKLTKRNINEIQLKKMQSVINNMSINDFINWATNYDIQITKFYNDYCHSTITSFLVKSLKEYKDVFSLYDYKTFLIEKLKN